MAASDIARHVPYLRRYARALTGSQGEGDAAVKALFEALVDESVSLDAGLDTRLALFRAFHASWRRALNGHAIDNEALPTPAERRLQSLSPEFRAPLLLVLMEGFTEGEAATILKLPLELARARLFEAEAQIEAQLSTDVLIIEDEPIVALELERLVREMGHHVAGGVALDPRRGRTGHRQRAPRRGWCWPTSASPDAAPAASRPWAIILIRAGPPVIFITAFPGSLLTGDRPEPAFLVVKPFREEELRAVIGQAELLFFHTPRAPGAWSGTSRPARPVSAPVERIHRWMIVDVAPGEEVPMKIKLTSVCVN